MNNEKLHMFASSDNYAYDGSHDPLKYYYYPLVGRLYRKRVEMCLNLLPGGARVLEVGFGCGICFLNLHNLYQQVHGLDLHSDCAAITDCFAAHQIDIQLQNGSVVDLPYPDDYFDAVLLISILEHLKADELGPALAEVHRVIRPGGAMVYGVPVERPLMTFAFAMLGCNIRNHHFSIDKEIMAESARRFSFDDRKSLQLVLGACLRVYEACRFVKE